MNKEIQFQDQIYLLQSRPMTATKSFSAWELLHEMDTAVMSDEDLFTFGNVGEVMPEVMSPLTSSVLVKSFESGLFRNFPICPEGKFFYQIMAISHNRLEMNVFGVFLRIVNKEITIQNRVHGLSVFGHEFLTEEIHRLAVHRYGVASKFLELWNIVYIFKCGWSGKSIIDGLGRFMKKFIGHFDRRNLKQFQSMNDLYDDLTQRYEDEFNYVQGIHGLSSMMSSVYQIILLSTIGEGKHELNGEYLSDITTLLSSCENAESAEIPTALEEIAATLKRCNSLKAQEFCDIQPDKGIEWLSKNCITAYTLFEAFIQKNAHRGYQEVMT